MAGTVFPLTGAISINSIKSKYGSTTVPVSMDDTRRVSTTGGNPKSPGTQSAGICDFISNETIPATPTGTVISLSSFRGTGVRFVDQSNIQDTNYKDDWVGFLADTSSDGFLTGYSSFGVATGGIDFGTPVSKGTMGIDTSTFLEPLRVKLGATQSSNSGGMYLSTDGPDQPYFYMVVTGLHPDKDDIISSTFKNTWYALALREYTSETSGYQRTIYYKYEDAVELNGAGSPAFYGWYWDKDVVSSSDIAATKYYYAYLVQAGF